VNILNAFAATIQNRKFLILLNTSCNGDKALLAAFIIVVTPPLSGLVSICLSLADMFSASDLFLSSSADFLSNLNCFSNVFSIEPTVLSILINIDNKESD